MRRQGTFRVLLWSAVGMAALAVVGALVGSGGSGAWADDTEHPAGAITVKLECNGTSADVPIGTFRDKEGFPKGGWSDTPAQLTCQAGGNDSQNVAVSTAWEGLDIEFRCPKGVAPFRQLSIAEVVFDTSYDLDDCPGADDPTITLAQASVGGVAELAPVASQSQEATSDGGFFNIQWWALAALLGVASFALVRIAVTVLTRPV